jgi:signal transduction histidine kinase
LNKCKELGQTPLPLGLHGEIMTIRMRLYLSLLAIVALPGLTLGLLNIQSSEKALRKTISQRIQTIAHQGASSIKTVFTERISEAKGLALNESVIAAVKASNASFARLSQDDINKKINQIDTAWIADKHNYEIAHQINTNTLSKFLRQYVEIAPDKYGEIFITNALGATVGATKILTDYYQADETWWEKSFANGSGDIFIDDRGYDESVNSLVTGVVVPILDNDKAIGVLKINFKIDHVLNLIAAQKQNDQNFVSLARSNGTIIVSNDSHHKNLSKIEKAKMGDNHNSGFVTDLHEGEQMIMGYAPVDLSVNTRVPTPGEKKGVSGEVWEPVTWYVFVDIHDQVAFSPVYQLKRNHNLLLAVVVFFAALLAAFLAKSINTPIQTLQNGAARIQNGDFDHEISLNSKDELGNLADSINTMARSLIIANTNLDAKVKERTLELESLNKHLKQSNEDLKQFAYVASHDLQEPLRMVASYTHLLADRYEDQLDEKAKKYIYYAVDGAKRMQALIQDLLSFSRVNTHGSDFEEFDANNIVTEVINRLELKISDTRAKIQVNDLPVIKADPSQISQVFQNLISNAIKFRDMQDTKSPDIVISAKKEETCWCFSVKDNGIGVEAQYKDKIFIIFQRLHTRKDYPGTGIGLAVCKRVVQRHGGKIWFDSEPGKGSVFYFTIPI